ncbi:MAG: glycosyltransferase, partial [Gemmatimonadales bacterium]
PVGISWDRFDSPVTPSLLLGRDRPFILSVASHYSHKNLETLLRAFGKASRSIPHDLVLVGQRRAHLVGTRNDGVVDIETLTNELGLSERVIITGHTTDAEVGWCYVHASLFVFPSLFEGFGMPAVEALGFGLPTISTRCGSLPEVTRGLAHLISDPTDVDELADAIQECLRNPAALQPQAASIAKFRAHFAPKRIAQLYLDTLTT